MKCQTEKDKYSICYHFDVGSKKQYEWIYQNRNRLIDIEKKLGVTSGRRKGELQDRGNKLRDNKWLCVK